MSDVRCEMDAALANGSKLEITAVDSATSVKLSSSVDISGTVAANDYLVVHGNLNQELTGVRAVMESTTLYGIARADYPFLNANREQVNGEIQETLIQKKIDEADIKAGAVTNFLL